MVHQVSNFLIFFQLAVCKSHKQGLWFGKWFDGLHSLCSLDNFRLFVLPRNGLERILSAGHIYPC